MPTTADILTRAYQSGIAVPAFNIAYLPMMEPVVRAVADLDSFALVETARLEWYKFGAQSAVAIAREFSRWRRTEHVRLHLDHVPVIDEDGQRVDVLPVFQEALALGYESVMIDGSRLPLEENICATRQVADLAGRYNVPVEAELGAVMGHETGPLPPYEELYASGKGFTDVAEAARFARESGCAWLSVAIGNVHGAIAAGRKDEKKVTARLNLERLDALNAAVGLPLVLHGGSGIQQDNVRAAAKRGIAKINVGTEIRQPYEAALKEGGSVAAAQEAVYRRTCWVIEAFLGNQGIRKGLVSG
jgi:ketose-bisphosphate aldolase